MKIVLDFNVKFGREDIFKPTIRNESLHQDSNDNCVRTVKCATSTSLVFKRLGCSAPKLSYMHLDLPDSMTHNQIDLMLIKLDTIRVYSMYDVSEELTLILITISWFQ